MPLPVRQLFSEVLGAPVEKIDDRFSPATSPLWDSLQSMNLVMALEDEFGVRFSTKEIVSMTSVGVVREVLRGKGIADA